MSGSVTPQVLETAADRTARTQKGSFEALRLRGYDPSRDINCLERICRNVYDGRDYLPRVIDLFVESPDDHPMVLESPTTGRLAALGNVQIMGGGDAWLQAIRVDECDKRKGMGTEITRRLVAKCGELGAKRVLSSTTPGNPAMRRIFVKLGFRKYASCGVWFSPIALAQAPADSESSSEEWEKGMHTVRGDEFLQRSGLGACCASAVNQGTPFETCTSVDAVKVALLRTGGGQYVVGEYRVHSVDQELAGGAVREGMCWIAEPPSKEGVCVAVAWKSPELSGSWMVGISANDPELVKSAILEAARRLDAPFGVAISGVEASQVMSGECLSRVGECELFEAML